MYLQVKSVERKPDGLLTVNTTNGTINEVNCLIWAVGRLPATRDLNLDYVVCNFILNRSFSYNLSRNKILRNNEIL